MQPIKEQELTTLNVNALLIVALITTEPRDL